MTCGLIVGLYVFFISLTGSVLVYRNELLEAVMPLPPTVVPSEQQLDREILESRLLAQHPNAEIERIFSSATPLEAAEVWLLKGGNRIERYADPYTGEDLGSASRFWMNRVYDLMQAHKNFFAGDIGLTLNGVGALCLLMMCITGLLLWWPGVDHWRQRLWVGKGGSWRRSLWEFHGAVGFWSAAFIATFAISGTYLCFQDFFNGLVNHWFPYDFSNPSERLIDHLMYLVTFLHFGRINGIALPCDGPGLCDQTFKAIWAAFGAAPAILIGSGFLIWRNRRGS